MERRIFGVETEYGVTFTFRGQRRLSPDEVSRFLFRKVVAWGRSSNVFLENGSRLYLDVGSHPEYATAECDNLYDLVAQDKAGEAILQGLVDHAQQQLDAEGVKGEIYLFKNNSDSPETPTDVTRITAPSAKRTSVVTNNFRFRFSLLVRFLPGLVAS